MRLRIRNRPADMAAIRHVALNLIRAIPDKASLKIPTKDYPLGEQLPCLNRLDGTKPESELIRALPAGGLAVEQVR